MFEFDLPMTLVSWGPFQSSFFRKEEGSRAEHFLKNSHVLSARRHHAPDYDNLITGSKDGCPHCSDGNTEVQQSPITCPEPLGEQVVELGCKPQFLRLQTPFFTSAGALEGRGGPLVANFRLP